MSRWPRSTTSTPTARGRADAPAVVACACSGEAESAAAAVRDRGADGRVEAGEQLAQLGEPAGAEFACPFRFDVGDDLADGLDGAIAALGEMDAFRALIAGVAATLEVAGLLHLPEQV